jgi:hypothetical protein
MEDVTVVFGKFENELRQLSIIGSFIGVERVCGVILSSGN